MNIDFEALWKHVSASFFGDPIYSPHGPAHWKRVERNGLLLATRTGADVDVVRLFAIFHDSRRENDMTDPEHGLRGALYARSLKGSLFDIDDYRFDLLDYACTWHTDIDHSDDPTIGSCWDADRLDLGRVGMIPNRRLMSTDFGKLIADTGTIYPFIKQQTEQGAAANP
jgi:uncharacterized protein